MPENCLIIRAGTPLLTYAEQWLAHCRRHTVNTQKLYCRVIHDFIHSLPADIGQLSPVDIDIYINQLLSRMKNSAANTYLTAIKSFFTWLNKNYDLPNIAENASYLKEDPPEVRVLNHAEYLKVLEANKDNPNLPAIVFLAHTGLRASEFLQIKPSDIEGKWLKVRGKGRKVRYVPFNKVALESLTHLKIPKSRMTLWRICSKSAKIAEIPVFGPHSLRHYFASQLLIRGVPIMAVSKLLGHASVNLTERVYFHYQHQSLLSDVTDVLEE